MGGIPGGFRAGMYPQIWGEKPKEQRQNLKLRTGRCPQTWGRERCGGKGGDGKVGEAKVGRENGEGKVGSEGGEGKDNI